MPSRALLLLAAPAATLASLAAPAASPAVGPAHDRHIVVLHDRVEDPGAVAREHGRLRGAGKPLVSRAALKGYAATFPAGRFRAVARDRRSAASSGTPSCGPRRRRPTPPGARTASTSALPLSGSYAFTVTF